MTATQTLREKCYTSLASATCPTCGGNKKTRQSFCLLCYRKLPRKVQQDLYNSAGYEQTWEGAMQALGAKM